MKARQAKLGWVTVYPHPTHSPQQVLQTLSQLLPLPCPPDDQPRTLDDGVALKKHSEPSPIQCPSLPVEDEDETSSLSQMVWVRVRPDSVSVLQDSAVLSTQSHPCECSQSEVTFLGCMDHNGGRPGQKERQQQQERRQPDGQDKHTTAAVATSASASACASVHTLQSDGGGEAALDLYGSWPVQCSCAPDADAQECEDCRANGFSPLPLNFSQGKYQHIHHQHSCSHSFYAFLYLYICISYHIY